MVNARANIWCRDCGCQMHQAPYNILAFYCKKCGIKAEIQYSKTPILVAKCSCSEEEHKRLSQLSPENQEVEQHLRGCEIIKETPYPCPECGKNLKFLMNDYFCECGYSDCNEYIKGIHEGMKDADFEKELKDMGDDGYD